MAFIRTIAPEQATGLLKNIYSEASARAGRIWNVVRLMSLNPRTLRGSLELYMAVMHRPSKLTRAQREMIATVVSCENNCYY